MPTGHAAAVDEFDAKPAPTYPALQLLQLLQPDRLYCPTAHGSCVARVPPPMQWYPGGHGKHCVDADTANDTVPAGHTVQAAAPALLYRPPAHGVTVGIGAAINAQ